ncbi:MAG: RAMP superfamily CRISPR-associated protein [Bryobacterales bacterium]|nr:RAMP superfamily CRISPR-associated protein [Bryobacterales bacterium]
MLKRLVNELCVDIEIETKSNLLIKDGRLTPDVKDKWLVRRYPDKKERKEHAKRIPSTIAISRESDSTIRDTLLDPVNNATPDKLVAAVNNFNYYIPGSSVRGAWRSHLEKVLRSIDGTPRVCDPLLDSDSCSTFLIREDQPRRPDAYSVSCPVCRIFGSAAHASRVWFADARFFERKPVLVDNVAISRQTGSVLNPFKSIALREAKAKLEMRIRNFELWHLGLLANLFTDLADSAVPLGSGKNKGFGKIKATPGAVRLIYFGLKDPCAEDSCIRGLQEIVPDPFYDYKPSSIAYTLPAATNAVWRHTRTFTDPEFWEETRKAFNARLWEQVRSLVELRKEASDAHDLQH